MAISRYKRLDVVIDNITNKPRLESFPAIKSSDIRDDINDIIIEFVDGMRFDTLAFQYLGDGRYWWAICLLNDLSLPFGSAVLPGTRLRIPTSINRILEKIEQKASID